MGHSRRGQGKGRGAVGRFAIWGAACVALVSCAAHVTETSSGTRREARLALERTAIGFEYALVDNDALIASMADAFGGLGLTAMKPYAGAFEWGAMQKRPNSPIDFGKLDSFVRDYQRNGFGTLLVPLKPHCRWAASGVALIKITDPTPKPAFRTAYMDWVRSVVERYDGDGRQDMPGLRWPVRMFEIGSEFSSYEPEPVSNYLRTLGDAYRAAHSASDEVLVAHAAFLTTPVNLNVAPEQYERVFETTRRVDQHHGLEGMRRVLDHPQVFDLLNLHNLGDPYEIEDQMRWLKFETSQRGYSRPVIVSDTLATSYIAWGSATKPKSKDRGVLMRPAQERDRERLAGYFQKLIDKDPATLKWTRGFVAADHVQRAVVAAEQGVRLINLAFVADLHWLKWGLLQGGAGISAWVGALDISARGKVKQRYSSFYAVRQLMTYLEDYESVTRVEFADPRVRVYEIDGPAHDDKAGTSHPKSWTRWVAWYNPQRVLLAGDEVPRATVELSLNCPVVKLETVITAMGEEAGHVRLAACTEGKLRLRLGHVPIFISGTPSR